MEYKMDIFFNLYSYRYIYNCNNCKVIDNQELNFNN